MATEDKIQEVFDYILGKLDSNQHLNVIKGYLDGLLKAEKVSRDTKEAQCKR